MFDKNPQLEKKFELMREHNNKAFAREAADNWRKHVPVYGWMKVNYPSVLQLPLKEKYNEEKSRLKAEKALQEKLEEEELSKKDENINNNNNANNNNSENKLYRNKGSRYRVDPEIVNEKEMKELEKLVPKDYSQKFLQNYEKNDFGFLKKQFKNYDLQKKGFDLENQIPHNYAKIISEGDNKFLYQIGIENKDSGLILGEKNAATYLTTMDYEKKAKFIDNYLVFDQKYCTMYPKSALLGPKQDNNFENKSKKLGDISFDESNDEVEYIKNLRRLPPENITEEWVKENLTEYVQKINFENCYWLTKDLLSKLGRLDTNLKVCSLRNLDLSNYIVENILFYAKNITELNLSNCTGLTNGLLEIICEKGKKIEDLNVFNIPNAINDNGLVLIGQNMKQLSKINLGRNKSITDKGIKGLIYGGLHFEKIDISYCFKITDESLQYIFQYSYKYLKEIYLNCLPLITEDGLNDLSKCSLLTTIEVIGTLTNSVVTDKFSSFENLELVDISGCKKIKDSDLTALINRNKKLKILRCSNCILLTNVLLEYFSKDSNHLLLLEINRTPLITDQKIEEVREKMKPNLRIIRATNVVWQKKNYGLVVPYQRDNYEKPLIKGAKKPQAKKNDDKSPEAQLIKLREEMRPKMIGEYFLPEDKPKKGKGKKK